MQKTRQKILEYLKHHGEATVEELSHALDDLTAVTVRHHLDVLRTQGMISAPEVRHRSSPGRPRYVYTLTDQALAMFPRNVNSLTHHMLGELKDSLNQQQINVIFEGVASRMAAELEPGPEDETFEERLDRVVNHLTLHGYEASWEPYFDGGYVLHTSNCPYSGVVEEHHEVCLIDIQYIARLLGTVPRRLAHIMEGAESCSYLIHAPESLSIEPARK